MLDLEKMLSFVPGDAPAGKLEEYSPLYLQLDVLARGKPASTMGDSIIEGTDPDWYGLRNACLKLWETTRDLRVAMYLAIAEFSLDGLKGFSDALAVTEYLVEHLWADFFPKLDPDDDNDPTERLNIFAMISPPSRSYSDPLMFISKFRLLKLVEGKRYTLRDLLILNGELDVSEETIDPVLFQGEMRSVPIDEMRQHKELVVQIVARLDHITELVNGYLPGGEGPVFADLKGELKTLQNFYDNYLLSPDAGAAEEPAETDVSGAVDAASGGPVRRSAEAFDLNRFVPANRAEALLMLKKSAEYFQMTEPTNPVPLLVDRALRMANMSFLDLLGEVEPGALEKGREIFGVRPEAQETSSEE